jgi:hypothetical protein
VEGITADHLKAANVKLMVTAWATAIPTTHNNCTDLQYRRCRVVVVIVVVVAATLHTAMMTMMMQIAVEVILH